MSLRRSLTPLALGAALALTALPGAARAQAVQTVTITARDFAFDVPDTLAAGRTAITLANGGQELHHAFLVKLEGGRTMQDFAAAMEQVMKPGGGPPPAWARSVGGPNAPAPGGTFTAVVDLQPGTYALLCVIPSPDGTPHVMKGMSRELHVLPAGARAIPAANRATRAVPAPDITMTLVDYGYQTSKPLTRGKHVIRVRNGAAQDHEVFIAKLAPGKSTQDALAWLLKMDGPPPLMPIGGTAALAKGAWNDIMVDLEPGEYGLFCFVPDAKDGREHVHHGMVRQFRVQ